MRRKRTLRAIDREMAVDAYPDRAVPHKASDYYHGVTGNADFTIITEKGLSLETLYDKFSQYPDLKGKKRIFTINKTKK